MHLSIVDVSTSSRGVCYMSTFTIKIYGAFEYVCLKVK